MIFGIYGTDNPGNHGFFLIVDNQTNGQPFDPAAPVGAVVTEAGIEGGRIPERDPGVDDLAGRTRIAGGRYGLLRLDPAAGSVGATVRIRRGDITVS
jgi:hypothetical protein